MKKLLWIEDDYYVIYGLMRPILKTGIVVEIANSYTNALEKLDSRDNFNAFVVDLILPVGDDETLEDLIEGGDKYLGISLIKKIREYWPKVPVFVLTVVNNDAVTRTLAKLEVHLLLKKPILPSELRDVILGALGTDSEGKS